MKTFQFDKLVRDGIVPKMESQGLHISYHVAEGEEKHERLMAKLFEEYEEFTRTPSVEEACDVWEVSDRFTEVYGTSATWKEANSLLDKVSELCIAYGFDIDTIEKAQIEKRRLVGGFAGLIVIDTVSVPHDDNENLTYLLQKGYSLVDTL